MKDWWPFCCFRFLDACIVRLNKHSFPIGISDWHSRVYCYYTVYQDYFVYKHVWKSCFNLGKPCIAEHIICSGLKLRERQREENSMQYMQVSFAHTWRVKSANSKLFQFNSRDDVVLTWHVTLFNYLHWKASPPHVDGRGLLSYWLTSSNTATLFA